MEILVGERFLQMMDLRKMVKCAIEGKKDLIVWSTCLVCLVLSGCVPEDFEQGAKYGAVNLGLSVMWANCNVGASSPEDYGKYYSWGELEDKESYYWEDYAYWSDYDYDEEASEDEIEYLGRDISGYSSYDVARAKWGEDWRMPTLDEIQELMDECYWYWTTVNGVAGYRVMGPNGNSIFLPAAGDRSDEIYEDRGWAGYYWCSTLDEEEEYKANILGFNEEDGWVWYIGGRSLGLTIRPVKSYY